MMYARVPKGMAENLSYREKLIRECRKSPALAVQVREACRGDLLFWLNTFGWTHDPWRLDGSAIPFTTYGFQDEAFGVMEDCLREGEDLAIVKSRRMGASWMICALYLHRWQFHNGLAFGVVSREERLVDGHPKSLFAKIQFMIDRQPEFLVPSYDHFHLQFVNKDNGSTIEGATTTGNVFRGDRYTSAALDEFAAFDLQDGRKALAASQFATPCRFFNSTPQGAVGAFSEVAHNPRIKRLDLHWVRHPEYSVGLTYRDDGRPTSEWYEGECKRLAIASLIAQELDLNFAGSDSPFFDGELLIRLKKDCIPPLHRGVIEGDVDDPVFRADPNGDLLVWDFVQDGKLKRDRFVVGGDISLGRGATPSVLMGASCTTGEKVCELVNSRIGPSKFADTAVRLCNWLYGAMLCWEKNGPGLTFGTRVMELCYTNVYYRQDEHGLTQRIGKGMVPGWDSNPVSKFELLQQYVNALEEGRYVNRSVAALDECDMYNYVPGGGVEHSSARAASDPSQATKNHGDRVIADALTCKLLPAMIMPEQKEIDLEADPPVGSFAHRRKERMALVEEWW